MRSAPNVAARRPRGGLIAVGVAVATIIASTSSVPVGATAARSVPLAAVSIARETGLRVVDGVAFTGRAVERFANGRLAREEVFVDGRRHGVLRRWFPDGQIAYEAWYEAGRRHGVAQSWWHDGTLRSSTPYRNDAVHGVAWQWYDDGQPYKRGHYAQGQPTGLQQGWRRNGALFSNFEYRNGRAYGLRNANLCVEVDDEQVKVTGMD